MKYRQRNILPFHIELSLMPNMDENFKKGEINNCNVSGQRNRSSNKTC